MKFQSRKAAWRRYLSVGALLPLGLVLIVLSSLSTSAHATASSTGKSINSQLSIRTTINLGGLPHLAMMSEQDGWGELSGTLRHSSDGGQTWQSIAQPHSDLEFINVPFVFDGQTAWYPTTDFQTSGTNTLYRTNDGGQSWASFPNPQPSLSLATMSIIDPQTALVYMTNFDTKEDHLFLVGADGQNWREIPLPVPGPFNSLQLHFLSQQVGWVIVTPVTLPASQDLYMTRDGGQSWTKQNLSIPKGVSPSSLLQIQPLGFANAQLGFLHVSFLDQQTRKSSAYVYQSLNGGVSWSVYGGAQPDAFEPIVQIDFWNVVTPVFVTLSPNTPRISLAKVRFGKWETQTFPEPAAGPGDSRLSRFSNSLMFMSAPANSDFTVLALYKSTDGGQTWQQIGTASDV